MDPLCAFYIRILLRCAQKQMQKCAGAAGKLAILTPTIVRVCAACAASSAPRMQNFLLKLAHLFCRFCVERGRRKNRRGRIEGNCCLLPILLNFFSVRFRERKQDKKEYLPLKNNVKLVSIVTFRNRRGSGPDFAEIVRMGCRSPWFHRFLQRKGS